MTGKPKTLFPFIACILGALVVFIFACQLTGNDKVEQRISFGDKFDSLSQFDSILIVLKDTTGRTIDIVYRGKVDTIDEINNLRAPHWDGRLVVVSISGFKGGETVYVVNTKFDGVNDKKIDSVQVILPGTSLSAEEMLIRLTEGDSIPLPSINVAPAELSDKTLLWTSSSPKILRVGPGYLKALGTGTVQLTATLKSNTAKSINLEVTIRPDPVRPESLVLSPDTLFLAAGGSTGILSIHITPASADQRVTWMLRDTSIAGLLGEGIVQGFQQGETRVVAVSQRNASIIDSSEIVVSGPVKVENVRFQNDSVDLFLNGVAESLIVAVLPPKANLKLDFEILDPSKIVISNGKILGIAEGSSLVIAHSSENPSKSDTLKAIVFPQEAVDSVRVSPDTLRLFVGGESIILAGKAYPPTVPQGIHWRSQNTRIVTIDANGKASAESPGQTIVIAQSRVDSSKQDTAIIFVKKDVPQVFVGRDTVVSVGASLTFRPQVSQEYGSVSQFRWDFDGDGQWDGSSDSLKSVSYTFDLPKEYSVGFYVKDSEGNDTTVFRKIKAVNGPAVLILSPLDNTFTKEFAIAISWTINGKTQDSLTSQKLKLGPNAITRTAKDEAGNLFSSSITVFVDTTPPLRPIVKGPSRTASKTPTWSWAGGGGGSGIFKYSLDIDDASLGKETKDTAFTPATELSEGLHTLFVSERDAAGNWSLSGRFALFIDTSPPNQPTVSVSPTSPTNVRKPKWTWSSAGNGGSGTFRYKLDNPALNAGATSSSDTSFTPASNLSNGIHILYVQENDSAGNWSSSGSATIAIDTIAPNSPTVSLTSTSPTNNAQPTWNWSSGGNGGKGFYRYKLGDTNWVSGGMQGSVTTFAPASALPEGIQTLFVEEQDSAGNWSGNSSRSIKIDLSPPNAPKVSTSGSPTSNSNPIWSWSTGGNGGSGIFRIKLGNSDLQSGATVLTDTVFTPGAPLDGGATYTLFVQEKDTAGNWSNSGYSSVQILGQYGYAVGSGGTILKTSNGGSSWLTIASGTNKLLQAVYFRDANTGLVLGASGTLRKTQNGGSTWDSINISSTGYFNSVSFPGNSIGFAAADDGTIAKTINGGDSWTSSTIGGGTYLLGIHFPTASTGYAVGLSGKILKTSNSGATWSQLISDSIPNTYLRSVYFTDSLVGYVCGDGGKIIKTIDGGISWISLPTKTTSTISSVYFPTSKLGFAVGLYSVFRTIDGGATWEEKVVSQHPLISIKFQDSNIGYIAGDSGTILKTSNGGVTWIEQQSGSVQTLYSISFP